MSRRVRLSSDSETLVLWDNGRIVDRGNPGEGVKAFYSRSLRSTDWFKNFEAGRTGAAPILKKRVEFIGQAQWCRLTEGLTPCELATARSYGYRHTDGNLYKIKGGLYAST